jgi:hypothetical protein
MTIHYGKLVSSRKPKLVYITKSSHSQWKIKGNIKPECGWCAHYRGANIVILKQQRSISEGEQEIVKRYGRDESIWVVIHLYMEAMLGISLYSYLYLKLAKTLCLSYYLLCFLFNKIGEEAEQALPESRVVGSKQCIHM